MPSTIVGGAMLPHAPQFFTLPETEDKATVARVRDVAARIGAQLAALEPDLWIIFSNDHAEQFFHTVAPAFTIHVGGEASGHFAGRDFHWKVPGAIGQALVRDLYRQGFDPAFSSTARIDYAIGIPLTHLGLTAPVLPIYVNAYLPPQPTMERCYAFGQAVARAVGALGLRTVVLASGGAIGAMGCGASDIAPSQPAAPAASAPSKPKRQRFLRRAAFSSACASASAARITSGVKGGRRKRTPVASNNAFAMAAAPGNDADSPVPIGGSPWRGIITTSITGTSRNVRIGYAPHSWLVTAFSPNVTRSFHARLVA